MIEATNIGEKLNDPNTNSKTYWSLLKRVLNNVKIPEIPPLIVNNAFVVYFIEKADLFNIFFNNQCSTLENGSVIPEFKYKTNGRIANIQFSSSDISKIIRDYLNPNKAHGHDNISIKMIQLCGESIIQPLSMIFESEIKSGHFPDCWKRGNFFPVHK